MRFLNSVKALYAAVGILFIAFVVGYQLDLQNDAMHARHLEISVELERMVRFDQELTSMLSLAVMEKNELRATRHETVLQDAAGSLGKIIAFIKDQGMALEISALSEGQKKIREREALALKHMREGRWKEAQGILFGDDYLNARKIYEIDSEAIPGIVRGEIAAIETRFNRIKYVALATRIGALLLLMWTGIMFSRRARADLAEQVRLRQEVSMARDALEERVRERTEELRLLLQSAGEGMFGLDAAGQVTFINSAALNLLGFSEEELIGKEAHALIHHSREDGSSYPREECPMDATCTSGTQSHVTDEALWRKDGQCFPVEYTSTPILTNEKVKGAVVTFRDITTRKQAEQELHKRMEDLEQFSRLTINREERMIQLKEEVNHLLELTGQEKKYKIVE